MAWLPISYLDCYAMRSDGAMSAAASNHRLDGFFSSSYPSRLAHG